MWVGLWGGGNRSSIVVSSGIFANLEQNGISFYLQLLCSLYCASTMWLLGYLNDSLNQRLS